MKSMNRYNHIVFKAERPRRKPYTKTVLLLIAFLLLPWVMR